LLEFLEGDIFADDAEAIVNPVNCVGVMGKGLALQFKRRLPVNYGQYRLACEAGEVKPGEMHVSENEGGYRWIVNFPTKRHYRSKSRIEDVRSGLTGLRALIERHEIGSIAVPALGSGLGGLEWSVVRGDIAEALADLDHTAVRVYEPR
jgi:O-acetyl-ADP-ribose deacetylase (regulator of RNase III)